MIRSISLSSKTFQIEISIPSNVIIPASNVWFFFQEYDPPKNHELELQTVDRRVDQCVEDVLNLLASHGIIPGQLVNDYKSWFKENQEAKKRRSSGSDDVVNELFVPQAQKFAATEEAKSLPKLDISELDMQWVQVCDSIQLVWF